MRLTMNQEGRPVSVFAVRCKGRDLAHAVAVACAREAVRWAVATFGVEPADAALHASDWRRVYDAAHEGEGE